jgi:uncharacterized protein
MQLHDCSGRHRPMKLSVFFAIALAASCSEGQRTSQSQPGGNVQRLGSTAQPKLALPGRVTDAANLLDAAQEAELSRRLEELERATGHQMVVVTVTTLGGEDVSTYTRQLGNAWGIGRAGENDGVILLVAPTERKVRIEVGSGLEKTLPNNLCHRIIQDEILPHFRRGDFPRGIEAGAKALAEQLE